MSVFPLKPSFSHFSISYLLWIPSKSVSPVNRTVARQPVDLSREVRFTYFYQNTWYLFEKRDYSRRIWKSIWPTKKACILSWFSRTTILLQNHQIGQNYMMTQEHKKMQKFDFSAKISRILQKNSTNLVDFFSKKHYFFTYFVQFFDRDEGIPWWFWTTQGFQKNTHFWKTPNYIAVKFDHIGRIFARYSVVFLKKGSFLEKLETIWWVSLKPTKVSFFLREILRFLRNFGGFMAKMRSKMTKMKVSCLSNVQLETIHLAIFGQILPMKPLIFS